MDTVGRVATTRSCVPWQAPDTSAASNERWSLHDRRHPLPWKTSRSNCRSGVEGGHDVSCTLSELRLKRVINSSPANLSHTWCARHHRRPWCCGPGGLRLRLRKRQAVITRHHRADEEQDAAHHHDRPGHPEDADRSFGQAQALSLLSSGRSAATPQRTARPPATRVESRRPTRFDAHRQLRQFHLVPTARTTGRHTTPRALEVVASTSPDGDTPGDEGEETHAGAGWLASRAAPRDPTTLTSRTEVREAVPEVGLEPTRSCDQRILSPPRLPFRHSGRARQR